MPTNQKVIAVEVTTLIQVSPDAERERLSLHFKGKSLARLLSMVDNVEAGKFYEGARTYYKECDHEEREAVGLGMSAIFEGVGECEVKKMEWWGKSPVEHSADEVSRDAIRAQALNYPRFTLVELSKPDAQATLDAVLGEENQGASPSP